MFDYEGHAPEILFVDTECKPGHWIGGDYVSKLTTAIAWSWLDEDKVEIFDHYTKSRKQMLELFEKQYDVADIVVGHYERGFDLPLLNGMREREGLSPFEPALTVDTKLDRLKTFGRSQSQKNLSADYGLREEKLDVTLREWEGFNEKEPGPYRTIVRQRVGQDVLQCKALYVALRDRGMLGRPKLMDYAPAKGWGYRA